MLKEVPLLLCVLLIAAVLILALVQWSFTRIRSLDTALFEKLGRPDLFRNNTYSTVWLYWRWVFAGSLKKAPPRSINLLLWLIRALTVAYAVGVLGLLAQFGQ